MQFCLHAAAEPVRDYSDLLSLLVMFGSSESSSDCMHVLCCHCCSRCVFSCISPQTCTNHSKRSCPAGVQLLFRSVNKLLMDTATSEYLFCSDFFQEAAVFHELFAPTLQVVESALAAALQVSATCRTVPGSLAFCCVLTRLSVSVCLSVCLSD